MEITQPHGTEATKELKHIPTTLATPLPTGETHTHKIMRVMKRDGTLEPVDVNKIINVVLASSTGLAEVDPMRVATKAISGLYDGATTKELDELCIRTASFLISEEPNYSKLAARLLSRYISEEIRNQKIHTFFDYIVLAHREELISDQKFQLIRENKEAFSIIVDNSRTESFEYFGLKTIYDRYLLRHPRTRQVMETPQYFFLRVACGLANDFKEAKGFYDLISNLDYLPSSPTLFNSATRRTQLSSCYLLDSPEDSLKSIYDKYKEIALLSKFAGGIGVSFSQIRSRGSLIKGTNGQSNGLIPWLKILDSSISAVNQGGRRKGAACVYIENWHSDVEEFLQLRDNTGDEAQRTHNLNLALWVSDLFMKRVRDNAMWSLFDPKEVPDFVNMYGEEFEAAFTAAEKEKKYVRQVRARDLYSRMMKTLAQTGNGWMNFKDASNRKSNQTLNSENVIHLSNLCTEILEVTSQKETAVCNLGSVNLSRHVKRDPSDGSLAFDFKKLGETVKTAVTYLDRVIDINFYPIDSAKNSNSQWRPVGLGLMGLQDVFFQMGWAFDSEEARELSVKIQEEIYYHATLTSCNLAKVSGSHDAFSKTRASLGQLQFDLWSSEDKQHHASTAKRWKKLKADIEKYGLRNSLLIAIAPTATIASIAGVYESIEPQISNYFKRETLSGEFIQINHHLVKELKKVNLWNNTIREKIKASEGSIQGIEEIPTSLKNIFRTTWEIPQKNLIDMAAARGPYVDQSQSLNLFIESPSIEKLSSMYMYVWQKELKTTYYLRSRPATRISKVTVQEPSKKITPTEQEVCVLENPESCEACQ